MDLDDTATVGDLQKALEAKKRPSKNLRYLGKELEDEPSRLLTDLKLTVDKPIYAMNEKGSHTIKIMIKTLTGKSREMELPVAMDISDVMKELRDWGMVPTGPGIGASYLTVRNRGLKEGTLEDNDVEDGDELFLATRMTGGGPGKAKDEAEDGFEYEGEPEVDDK
ncbi:hypothetical protein RSOL_372970, partial [Rhizoctonia solani AG-3 Rhs1AP]